MLEYIERSTEIILTRIPTFFIVHFVDSILLKSREQPWAYWSGVEGRVCVQESGFMCSGAFYVIHFKTKSKMCSNHLQIWIRLLTRLMFWLQNDVLSCLIINASNIHQLIFIHGCRVGAQPYICRVELNPTYVGLELNPTYVWLVFVCNDRSSFMHETIFLKQWNYLSETIFWSPATIRKLSLRRPRRQRLFPNICRTVIKTVRDNIFCNICWMFSNISEKQFPNHIPMSMVWICFARCFFFRVVVFANFL